MARPRRILPPTTELVTRAPDVLLTPEQVAERLATTPGWVYANWKTHLPFGQKLGYRTLRFSARALERHLACSSRGKR